MGSSRWLTYAPVLAGLGLMAVPAEAALPNCNVGALTALNVPNVTIVSVADVPASSSHPEFCDVLGTLTTTGFGAPDGSARFEIRLPATWNGKFLFLGVGGFAGSLNPSVNPVDFFESLGLGYATAVTDTGHSAGATDARWALTALGAPDEAKITDYYFRAAHQVTVAGKQLVSRYYRGSITRAYFDGCSNGGRMAFVEATKFPEDYDGIIAGAPFMDIRSIIAGAKFQKVQLSPANYIPASKLPAVDAAVYAACDAVDGVTDGLIQNPAKCSFNPNQLVPGTLTSDQAKTLKSYISALRDDEGNVIYEGAAITDLNTGGGMDLWSIGFVVPISFTANEPWDTLGFNPSPISWQFVDHFLKYVVERTPTFDLRNFGVSTNGVVSEQALKLFDERSEAGDGDVPAKLSPFIAQKRKMLIYHGFSDPALPPFRTIRYYEDLAKIKHGFDELQEHVRLFMVPGMQHCGGGPGPNVFDTLTALDNWVEHGVAPNDIVATHFINNNPALGVDRTMPLCKFPEQAVYNGSGPVKSASSWQCTRNHRLLELGANGRTAGLGDDDRDHDQDH
jgi:feruloyl esterase